MLFVKFIRAVCTSRWNGLVNFLDCIKATRIRVQLLEGVVEIFTKI